jgi:hypothetical protein
MSFPETGAIPFREVQALLQLSDLVAAIHELAREAEGHLWAPSPQTVANTIAVAEKATQRAGCPAVSPSEKGTLVLDWSSDTSWSTIEVDGDDLRLILASHQRQTTRRAGTMADLEEFATAVANNT